MPQVRLLRIVVASSGDVQAERDALAAVVEELNHGLCQKRGLRLELVRWETDAYPGFHPEGLQGLIDPVLRIADCDLLIGIFWKRFGTPVHDAQSGTEHEFLTAYHAWQQHRKPQIMVYLTSARRHLRRWRRPSSGVRCWRSRGAFPKTGCGGRIEARPTLSARSVTISHASFSRRCRVRQCQTTRRHRLLERVRFSRARGAWRRGQMPPPLESAV
jgi:Domain of unknown function (DUF4062)